STVCCTIVSPRWLSGCFSFVSPIIACQRGFFNIFPHQFISNSDSRVNRALILLVQCDILNVKKRGNYYEYREF
ncbi:hypothetical protein KKC91_03100, partial [bacterium]|nr:hypothetical protein [bacterium]